MLKEENVRGEEEKYKIFIRAWNLLLHNPLSTVGPGAVADFMTRTVVYEDQTVKTRIRGMWQFTNFVKIGKVYLIIHYRCEAVNTLIDIC